VSAQYNLRQTLLAILSCCAGICAFAVARRFFKGAALYAGRGLGGNMTPFQHSRLAWTCLAIIAITGFFRWRSGGGYHRSMNRA
jgi:uncharacterized membrane protein